MQEVQNHEKLAPETLQPVLCPLRGFRSEGHGSNLGHGVGIVALPQDLVWGSWPCLGIWCGDCGPALGSGLGVLTLL